MNLYILLPALLFLILLLYAESKESTPWKLASKPFASALFILTACLQPWTVPSYAGWITAGLVLSWIGDVFLIFSDSRKMFLSGLVAFLLGHVCYAICFYTHGVLDGWIAAGLAVLLVAGAVIFLWLRPHLGNMTGPVIGYIVVISAMVGGALAVFNDAQWAADGRAAVLAGAVMFYLSDIMVARDQFVANAYINRIVGLPLYYAAQFLFATSIGWI
jgi:uncharacterized membrane protein YhhN